jgi:putative modified peptide
MKLSDETADRLLDKLSTDDAFREQFQNDPRAALAAVGHAEAADAGVKEGAWSCMAVQQLASKEAIKASRDVMRKQLTQAKAGAHPITLETQRR